MSRFIKVIILVLALVLLLAACKKDEPEAEFTPEATPFEDEAPVILETYTFSQDDFPRLDGSPGMTPLAEALVAVMLGQSREDVADRAVFTRTTQAYRNLAAGMCDIILAGESSPRVLDEIAGQDFRYDMAPIATDALVFIVSSSNPVDNLTSEQVRKIYSGTLTKWQDAGGDNVEIAAYQRNEEALSQVLTEKLVMDWNAMADAPMQDIFNVFNTSFFDSELSANAIKGFDGSENAIGYTMYYYAANMGMADGYKILSIDGVMPTPDTISSGDYPFVSPYYAVINRDLTEDDSARILYNWLLSDDGQEFISSEGYVSIKDSPPLDDVEPVPPPEMRWSVTTDDSNLAPYMSPHTVTRFYNTALPSLEPYDGYGLILPYSTAVTLNDGSIYPTKYGFVAMQSKSVITDPVYDNITPAAYSSYAGTVTSHAPAYLLEIAQDDTDFGYRTDKAVCATDGRWITPFVYQHAVFRANVFFLMHDEETFNIDVYDYDGNLLYNMLELEWADRISEDTDSWFTIQSEGENKAFVLLDDDTYAVMNVVTGEITETDFVDAFTFSEGLACVSPSGAGGLWGFINHDLEFVIDAAYTSEAFFIYERAIVNSPDGKQFIIDTQGDVLYTNTDNTAHMISSLPDHYGFQLISLTEFTNPRFFNWDIEYVEYPEGIPDFDPESSVSYLKNGWISYVNEDGVWVFSSIGSYSLPASTSRITDINDRVIVYEEFDPESGASLIGAMTLEGDIVIQAAENQSLSVHNAGEYTVLVVNINTNDSLGIFRSAFLPVYARAEYKLISLPSGQELLTGFGVLSYADEAAGILSVQGTDYFAWIDHEGNTLVSIPSMAYTYD